jgi:nucleotide-binding universal stress UspA family protein
MYKHILIPTDGSDLSRAAALQGVKLAKSIGARVTAFFAAPPATPVVYNGFLPTGYGTTVEHAAIIAKTAAKYLGVIEKACAAAGVACQSVHVTDEFAAEAIMAVAKKYKCDLIFMASHARKGLSGVLLGSQTQKVLTQSKIPVLVYR